MDNSQTNRLYKDLAWTFPIISAPEEYIPEAKIIGDLIRKHFPGPHPPRTLLHLGCGGGHMDWAMKKEFQITGADISETMLGMARKLNPECDYVTGDMRTVRLGRTFDVVMIHDSINYMTTPEDFLAAFQTAAAHLKKDGLLFTFTEEWPEKITPNRTRHFTRTKGDITITLVENVFDPDPTDFAYEYTVIYIIRKGNELEVEHDRHYCGVFPVEHWAETIANAGFEIIKEELNLGQHELEYATYPAFIGLKK